LKQRLEATNTDLAFQDNLALKEDISQLARQLFGSKVKRRVGFTSWLWDTYTKAQGNDFLLIHNPGGWGCTLLSDCLEWEKSVVEGVRATIERLGHTWVLTQYFRSGHNWWTHVRDVKKEARFFLTGKSRGAEVMAAELRFITQHLSNLKVILIGASQGAAFSNAVMRHLSDTKQVYSIELGIFFPQMKRRAITERTLAVDGNGQMCDPMCHRDLWVGFKAYIAAPYRWVKYRLQGKPQKFTYCINAPAHDYSWEYPEVQQKITDFLTAHFGTKSKLGGR